MLKKLNVCFCGSSDFSLPFLYSLSNNNQINLKAVLTRCDQPANRGKRLTPNAVKRAAQIMHLPIIEPQNLTMKEHQCHLNAQFRAFDIDLVIVVAYGLIIPKTLLDICSMGWINVHASLLPRWRGAAPIARSLLAGDLCTGISIMKVEAGLDTGPYLLQDVCAIEAQETSQSLAQKLAAIGTIALNKALLWMSTTSEQGLSWTIQPQTGCSYAQKLTKLEAQIDWMESATTIERKIRGYFPWPIAWWNHRGELIRVLKASVFPEHSLASNLSNLAPGTVLHNEKQALLVQTGKGVIALEVLQWPNHKALTWAELRNQDKLKEWQLHYCLTMN